MATVLGVRDGRFTVNGTPTFLVGCSYFAGLSAPDQFIRRDLDELQSYGINCLRVWANWRAFGMDVAAIDRKGNPREPYLSKLQWLVRECDRRGIIVGVTLGRSNEFGEIGLPDQEAHRRAVVTLLKALQAFGNWYLDLAAERNIRDGRFVSILELQALREVAKETDKRRLLTASYSGDLPRNELVDYLFTVRVDFLAIHRPRTPQSPQQTEERTQQLRAWLRELECDDIPVFYQEPFRRGLTTWSPTAADFLQDLQAAYTHGAAGWCFANGDQRRSPDGQPRRSFDLRLQPLVEQLDEEERKFLGQLGEVMRAWESASSSMPAMSSPKRR